MTKITYLGPKPSDINSIAGPYFPAPPLPAGGSHRFCTHSETKYVQIQTITYIYPAAVQQRWRCAADLGLSRCQLVAALAATRCRPAPSLTPPPLRSLLRSICSSPGSRRFGGARESVLRRTATGRRGPSQPAPDRDGRPCRECRTTVTSNPPKAVVPLAELLPLWPPVVRFTARAV